MHRLARLRTITVPNTEKPETKIIASANGTARDCKDGGWLWRSEFMCPY